MTFLVKEGMARKAEEENALYGSVQPKVLVVDNDHQIVQVISRMMEFLGSRVDAANCGGAALNCLSKSSYDVVISDLGIPDLSGYILASWVREKSPDTKIVIMTARSREEVAYYMKTGIVDSWIFKPFSIKDMEATLNNIFQSVIQEA